MKRMLLILMLGFLGITCGVKSPPLPPIEHALSPRQSQKPAVSAQDKNEKTDETDKKAKR